MNLIELKKSENLALLLGMFAGDGCLSEKKNGGGHRIYPISFYNTNKDYVELFSGLFFNLFGIKGSLRGRERKNKKVLWEFEKYSVNLYKVFNEEFEMPTGRKALKVGIPSFILNGPRDSKLNFLKGLLITDGCIRKDGRISFHVASEKLINDLKLMISDLWGFEAKKYKFIQKGKYVSYQLNLNTLCSSKILSNLPSSHNLVLR